MADFLKPNEGCSSPNHYPTQRIEWKDAYQNLFPTNTGRGNMNTTRWGKTITYATNKLIDEVQYISWLYSLCLGSIPTLGSWVNVGRLNFVPWFGKRPPSDQYQYYVGSSMCPTVADVRFPTLGPCCQFKMKLHKHFSSPLSKLVLFMLYLW